MFVAPSYLWIPKLTILRSMIWRLLTHRFLLPSNDFLALNWTFVPLQKPWLALPCFTLCPISDVLFAYAGSLTVVNLRKLRVPGPNFQGCVLKTPYEPPPGSDYMGKCLTDLEHIMQHVSWTLRAKFNMTREQRSLLRTLRHSNTLHVLSSDKNLGPALMTRMQYIHFCLDHLNQPLTYQRSMSPVTAVTKLMKTRLRAYYFHLKANHAHLPDIAAPRT